MHTLILLCLIIFNASLVFSQTPQKQVPSQKQVVPSKNEIQSQMNEVAGELRKQIDDLKKQIKTTEDPEEKKSLQDQVAMLEKQLAMMQGLNKNVARMPDKAVQQGVEENGSATVPKRDITRISMLPKQVLTDAELVLFIKNVQSGVEKIIPPTEKAEALKIYNETKAQYKSKAIVANAANGCWMLGHWEKALFIMGKACMDDISDADNLNNYAAFLTMTGGEQVAIPILEYLNSKYPENSTILNNIGQAWFGLGDIEKAKKFLDETKILYPNHSMANNTLANIYEAEGDNAKAISFLKESLKENYDPEKEAQLSRLGYEIKLADMPPLNYPMKKDPLGLIPLINSWDPDKIQSSVGDEGTASALERYLNGVKNFGQELDDETLTLNQLIEERTKKVSIDSPFRQELLEPYNCPSYLLAARSLQLYCIERSGHCFKKAPSSISPLITGLWLPLQQPAIDPAIFKPITELIEDCTQIWFKEVTEQDAALSKALLSGPPTKNCSEQDARMNAYLAKRKDIYSNGVKLVKDEFNKHSKEVTNYLKFSFYADIDESELSKKDIDDIVDWRTEIFLLSETNRLINRRRNRNKDYRQVVALIVKAERFKSRYKSACKQSSQPEVQAEMGSDDLLIYKVKRLECEYIKKVETPVKYKFVLYCNNIKEEFDPNLPKKKVDVQIGEVHVTNSGNSSRGPITGPRGPNALMDETDKVAGFHKSGPLTSEYKDISQFSLEYNKWGNLVGFNFQLSDDGTTLKDPDSIESGIDSRWSWNAIASPKKGHLNKLIIK